MHRTWGKILDCYCWWFLSFAISPHNDICLSSSSASLHSHKIMFPLEGDPSPFQLVVRHGLWVWFLNRCEAIYIYIILPAFLLRLLATKRKLSVFKEVLSHKITWQVIDCLQYRAMSKHFLFLTRPSYISKQKPI